MMTAQLPPQDRKIVAKILENQNKKAALSVLQLLQKQVSHVTYGKHRG